MVKLLNYIAVKQAYSIIFLSLNLNQQTRQIV